MTTTGTQSTPRSPALDACPITPLVSVVSSRWTTPILWVLQHHGPKRFNELRRHLGPVTAKVLTARLRQLERDGLIRRSSSGAVPPRSDYTITELGLSLSPAFRELATWTGSHMHLVEQAREQYDASGRPRPA